MGDACDHLQIKQSGFEQSRFEPWLGTLHCTLGQDTLLTFTVPLSIQVYKWVSEINGSNHAMV